MESTERGILESFSFPSRLNSVNTGMDFVRPTGLVWQRTVGRLPAGGPWGGVKVRFFGAGAPMEDSPVARPRYWKACWGTPHEFKSVLLRPLRQPKRVRRALISWFPRSPFSVLNFRLICAAGGFGESSQESRRPVGPGWALGAIRVVVRLGGSMCICPAGNARSHSHGGRSVLWGRRTRSSWRSHLVAVGTRSHLCVWRTGPGSRPVAPPGETSLVVLCILDSM